MFVMNLYPQEEIDRIEKLKQKNKNMEDFFSKKRSDWNDEIEPLFFVLRNDFTIEKKDKIVEIQSFGLTFRQKMSDEISLFLNKRSIEDGNLKKAKQDKFLFYAMGFGLKTNMGEKSILIDAHVSENQRSVELIDTYLEFLRSSSKNLESLAYAIKNIIELMNYLK